MDVELKPGAEFAAAAARLRAAPKDIRKGVSQAIKAATAPAEKDLKSAALAIESKGTKGGGSKQRAAHTGKLPQHSGLRKNISRGVTRKITYAGARTGVRIRVDPKFLPPDQRVLLQKTNSGKSFRHPVMGNRNAWVSQQFSPAHWFSDTIRPHVPRIRKEISAAVRKALEQLQ